MGAALCDHWLLLLVTGVCAREKIDVFLLLVGMQEDGKTVERHPDGFADLKAKGCCVMGGVEGMDVRAATNVDNTFQGNSATGYTDDLSGKTVVDAAGGVGIAPLQIDRMRFDLSGYHSAGPESQPFRTVIGDHGADGMTGIGEQIDLRLKCIVVYFYNISEKTVPFCCRAGKFPCG